MFPSLNGTNYYAENVSGDLQTPHCSTKQQSLEHYIPNPIMRLILIMSEKLKMVNLAGRDEPEPEVSDGELYTFLKYTGPRREALHNQSSLAPPTNDAQRHTENHLD
jgi:hypothetical protein